MKNIIIAGILIITLFNIKISQAQNSNDRIWEALYSNDRKTALKLVDKFDDNKSNLEH
jgi:hypothetical protein